LPVPLTSLVGREADLTELESTLRREDVGASRLISLLGAPGTGKTRLAIAAAERVLGAFEHGVCFVDLSLIRETTAVPAAIAHELGATYRGRRAASLEDTLKRALRDRHALLVLDNFEGVIDAGVLVEDLLANCPRLRVVVTSRAPLATASEQQFEVKPLQTPNLASLPPLAALGEIAAVQLFVARVQPLRTGWELADANGRAVAEICARLDGLPLAIELAASWMNVLTPQSILSELPHTMSLRERGGADHGRHQTLDATIGWSYDLLSESERSLFERLAVFESGWTLDTCIAVCGDGAAPRSEMLRLLGSLVDKHLVTRSEDQDGNVRFGFLETIREYARGRLTRSGTVAEMQRLHARAFLDFTERGERELDSPAQAAWIERFEQERGNIRAALEWSTTAADADVAEIGLRIAATLWLFWDVRGHVQEGRQPLRKLLQMPAAQTPTTARARALLSEAWLGYVGGDVAEVETAVAEAILIGDESNDVSLRARAQSILGTTLASYTDEFERADDVLREALSLARQRDTWSTGFAVYNLGVLAMRGGHFDVALDYFEQCRHVSAATGNTFGVGCALFRVGAVHGTTGDRAGAVEVVREALRLHWELRNRRVVALCLQQLACLGTGILDPADQTRLFAVAETLFEQLPDYVLPPHLLAAHREGIENARRTLGEVRFGVAWTDGRASSLDQAVQLALGLDRLGTIATSGGLTGREVQVSGLVAEGLTNREIGVRLGLSHHTVDNHLRRIYGKVGVSSRTGLATWWVRAGLESRTVPSN
jgi:non-specific serine/threonine protein kinase